MSKLKGIRKAYVCGISFQHEFDDDVLTQVPFYPNLNSVKKYCKHDLEECGLMEVEIRCVRWEIPQDIFKNTRPTATIGGDGERK